MGGFGEGGGGTAAPGGVVAAHWTCCVSTAWRNRVQTGAMGFFVLKKNKSIIENPKTKEEEKVEAKKEKLPEEKLPATSIKDQVTHKPLV